ncbi:hypothetical protein HYDPIDRAFT_28797 [Hydnomerulius pinastri MD-312]|uniref:Uncharacterized protein n=1 Tax=Hydnomerulius pinastri MD-312 TaxID=994086 RepID=A0A0C9VFN8_9AGAM|nr:hypothetical protein HYDPIDRAFT_28797 [Hydnomerulius pinastri MD-312]
MSSRSPPMITPSDSGEEPSALDQSHRSPLYQATASPDSEPILLEEEPMLATLELQGDRIGSTALVSQDSHRKLGPNRASKGSKAMLRWCYSLHVLLVIIHVVLLAMLPAHPEHRVIIPFDSDVLITGLSALLQAFYTLYTALLVFITQRLALSSTLSRRQKLTAVHDTCMAWKGLGAAINGLWQQTKVAASPCAIAAIVAYLASVSVLHIASSTIMQFQTFNNSLTSTVSSTLVWPGPSVNLSTLDWTNVSPLLSLMDDLPALSTNGLTNNRLYDVPSNKSLLTEANVDATTLRAQCGLLSNVTTSPLVQLGRTPETVNVSVGGLGNVLIFVPNTVSNRVIDAGIFVDSVPTMAAALSAPSHYLFFAVTTAMDLDGLAGSPVHVYANLTSIVPDGEENQNSASIYFVGCSLDAYVTSDILDIASGQLQFASDQPNSTSSQWTLWSPPSTTNFNLNAGIVAAIGGSALGAIATPSPESPERESLSNFDLYFMSLLGIDIPLNVSVSGMPSFSPNQSDVNSSFTLSPYDMENALSRIAAQFIWLAGEVGESGGGFQRAAGESQVMEQVLELRLNIETFSFGVGLDRVKVACSFVASLVLLLLVPYVLSAHPAHKWSPGLGVGVLEILWIGSHSSFLRAQLKDIEDPSLEHLRSRGMFDTCPAEPLFIHHDEHTNIESGEFRNGDPPTELGGVTIASKESSTQVDPLKSIRDGSLLHRAVTDSQTNRYALYIWCYILHGTLSIIHVVLLVLLTYHPEHKIVFPLDTPSLAIVLGALLQAFYMVYTVILVFVTQQLALFVVITRKQKLTAIHDLSGTWSGIGAAIYCVWQQKTVPASAWKTIAATFQGTNSTFTSTVSSRLAWPDPSVSLTGLDWLELSPFLSVIRSSSDLSTEGLSDNLLYDIPVYSSYPPFIDASVNTTSLRAQCGLLSNLSINLQPPQPMPYVNFSINGLGAGTLLLESAGADTVYYVDNLLATLSYPPGPSAPDSMNLFFMVTTAMNVDESVDSVVSVEVNWTYNAPSSGPQTSLTTTRFVACSLDTQTALDTLDLRTGALSSSPSLGATDTPSQPWTLWSPSGSTELTTGIASAFYNSVADSQSVGTYCGENGCMRPTEIDMFVLEPFLPKRTDSSSPKRSIMSLLGLNLTAINATSATQSSANPSVTLSPYQMETAVAQMAAEFIWLAGEVGESAGGFQRGTGEVQATQLVLQWRLNINTIPVIFASLSSFVLLALVFYLVGRPSRRQSAVSGASVLEILWLGARSRYLREPLEDITDPSTDNLRAAGMFEVCLADIATPVPRP